MAEARQADPATHLLVDEMILEYLLDNATKALLKDRKAQRSGTPGCCSADLALSMVDGIDINPPHPDPNDAPG